MSEQNINTENPPSQNQELTKEEWRDNYYDMYAHKLKWKGVAEAQAQKTGNAHERVEALKESLKEQCLQKERMEKKVRLVMITAAVLAAICLCETTVLLIGKSAEESGRSSSTRQASQTEELETASIPQEEGEYTSAVIDESIRFVKAPLNEANISPIPIDLAELTAASPDEFPKHVLSSVFINNSGKGNTCSGTIISQPEEGKDYCAGIGCGHCYNGNIGLWCWVYNVYGQGMPATLVAVDQSLDISLFKVPKANVVGYAQIPSETPKTASLIDAVGFPGGRGPVYKLLRNGRARDGMWYFDVSSGQYSWGDSGGGIFIDGQLCGLMSRGYRARHDGFGTMGSPSFDRLTGFVAAHQDKIADCGQYWHTQNYGEVAPPPPAPVPQQPPQRQVSQAPPWRPNPNITIPPYQQCVPQRGQRLPDEYCRNTDQGRKIIALEQKLVQMEILLQQNAGSGQPGPNGLPGKDGRDGNPGKDGNPGQDGKNGFDGKDGRDGKTGDKGATGDKGQTGDAGNPADIGALRLEIQQLRNELSGLTARGIEVQILDDKGNMLDKATFPINGPLKFKKWNTTNTTGVVANARN